ncbi:MAG: hypothetical protein A2X22_04935 [Bacteroidetes bacterium GWF2_49_14]|nr:MAG: hypothetical protein A2X22_04935 [Bacteroidetes bacterium GWF2_49_14]
MIVRRIFPGDRSFYHVFITCILILLDAGCTVKQEAGGTVSFNDDWKFIRPISSPDSPDSMLKLPDSHWESVTLPHTAKLEPLIVSGQQWTGICWYKKSFNASLDNKGRHIGILFGAAMQDATVWLNGRLISRHLGGYLPFYLDISDGIHFDSGNEILIRLDNRENTMIPPGKPLGELDFLYYGGIYRNASLIIKDQLHLTHPLEIDTLQGGGVMVNTDSISKEESVISISVSVRNQDQVRRFCGIEAVLKDRNNKLVATASSEIINIPSLTDIRIPLRMQVKNPDLWFPDSPSLYTLETRLIENEKCIETSDIRIGLRTISFTVQNRFSINNVPLEIRGTNRHQEYPYIGYALSDNAQYRDAWKIKNAGFNFVRSSHYPQSPAFLDACDELGILVMNSIPGWQYFGDSAFCELSYQNTREMCRRDRNHPSVILWEASLNESVMPVDFMRKSHEIVHTELPFPDIYTCGWIDSVYDVFIPARQHSVPPYYWNNYPKAKPLFIAEYGSWEYYAQNAGFNQTEFTDLKPAERSSRQLRGYGERQLLQQAYNFQEAYNDILKGPSAGCSNWVMFDYNRGYASDIESSGIMDIFRLPKFAYWFYKSQADDDPVCFIASFNSAVSAQYVRVFCNGDSVVLYRNGILIGSQKPDCNPPATNLPHPPFTFRMPAFESGTLKAESYKQGKISAKHTVTTAGEAANISLEADLSNKELKAGCRDIIFVYASITDLTGNVLNDSSLPIRFTVNGDGMLIGDNPVRAEAGIATILLKAGKSAGKLLVRAESEGLNPSKIEIISKK